MFHFLFYRYRNTSSSHKFGSFSAGHFAHSFSVSLNHSAILSFTHSSLPTVYLLAYAAGFEIEGLTREAFLGGTRAIDWWPHSPRSWLRKPGSCHGFLSEVPGLQFEILSITSRESRKEPRDITEAMEIQGEKPRIPSTPPYSPNPWAKGARFLASGSSCE